MTTRTRIAVNLAVIAAVVIVPIASTPAGAAREHTIAAMAIDYLPPDSISINEGDTMTFVNTDPVAGIGHSVTQGTSQGAAPKFDSGVVAFGGSADVAGISELKQGEYLIQCQVHPIMTTVLFVGPVRDDPMDVLPLPEFGSPGR